VGPSGDGQGLKKHHRDDALGLSSHIGKQQIGLESLGCLGQKNHACLRPAQPVDHFRESLSLQLVSLSRWGAIESGTIDLKVLEERQGSFVCPFDQDLCGTEVER
jgi:hypothetical protein